MEKNLPNNDQDLILAKEVGEKIESGSSFSDLKNPFIDLLVEYKVNELSTIRITPSLTNLIWSNIQSKIQKPSATIYPLHRRSKKLNWASAAVIFIAVFLGIYWSSIQPNYELLAASDSTIKLVTLDDGSEIILRPYTRLYHKNKRNYSLEGEAFFNIVTNPNSPFSVVGNYGIVKVLGTKFNFSTWGNTDIVYLEEGKIVFKSNLNDNDELILSPGQSSQIKEGQIDLLSYTSGEQFIDWISDTLIFNGNTPNEVINEINQHYGVTINIDQLEDNSKIKGSLKLESLNQTLDDLGLVLGGTFKKISNKKYEFISIE